MKQDPENWNILVPGGKESNNDSVSRGDWKRRSPLARVTNLMCSRTVLEKQSEEGETPVHETD